MKMESIDHSETNSGESVFFIDLEGNKNEEEIVQESADPASKMAIQNLSTIDTSKSEELKIATEDFKYLHDKSFKLGNSSKRNEICHIVLQAFKSISDQNPDEMIRLWKKNRDLVVQMKKDLMEAKEQPKQADIDDLSLGEDSSDDELDVHMPRLKRCPSPGVKEEEKKDRYIYDEKSSKKLKLWTPENTNPVCSYKNEDKDKQKLATKKKVPCRYFAEGYCWRRKSCLYRHDEPSTYKTKLCINYLEGWCRHGAFCWFMHEEFPCYHYHRIGKCENGAFCRFSHDPLTRSAEKALHKSLNDENLSRIIKRVCVFDGRKQFYSDNERNVLDGRLGSPTGSKASTKSYHDDSEVKKKSNVFSRIRI